MSKRRRTRRTGDSHLTLVNSGSEAGEDPELAHLRELLSAVGAPADVLRALHESGDPAAIVQQLVESGFLPSQEDTFGELIDGFRPLLKRRTGALDAELAGVEFLSMLRAGALEPGDVPRMLADLIAQAEAHGKPEALAMVRILAVVGPAEIRPAAAVAGDRMAARRVKDPSWVAGLGAPQVGECFGYADPFGAQESIALTFSYGRKGHAFVVLIDHDLGGGVKDCWVSDRAHGLRTEYLAAAHLGGSEFQDYGPGAARAILDRALRRPPCPVATDQIEDVDNYLDLLRQRVALLPQDVADHPAPVDRPAPVGRQRAARPGAAGRTVHRVKISLRGAKPPIWRRLEMPSDASLQHLHHAIQAALGWENSHLWVFDTTTGGYGLPDRELGHRSAAARKLREVAPGAGDRLRYTYDFGDNWEHEIVVEEVLDAQPGVAYPRCVAGRRAGPPEDCGGIWGYQDLLAVLSDPDHEEHGNMLDWLGLESADDFDPARFDLDAVNKTLSTVAQVVVKA